MKNHATTTALLILAGLSLARGYDEPQDPEWKVPSRAARKKNPLPATDAVLAQGKAVYEAQCVSCHGTSGIGDGVAAKDLEKHPGDLTAAKSQSQTDGALFWKITNGRAPMTAFGDTLTAEQRWQVVHFIRSFGKSKLEITVPLMEAPERARASLTDVFSRYDAYRVALAKGDAAATTDALPALRSSVAGLIGPGSAGPAIEESSAAFGAWKKAADSLTQAVTGLSAAKDLTAMRSAFGPVSASIEAALSRFGHSYKSPVYVFECTKANGSQTARWLQTDREPGNPYLGSEGVSCVELVKGLAGTRPDEEG